MSHQDGISHIDDGATDAQKRRNEIIKQLARIKLQKEHERQEHQRKQNQQRYPHHELHYEHQ